MSGEIAVIKKIVIVRDGRVTRLKAGYDKHGKFMGVSGCIKKIKQSQ